MRFAKSFLPKPTISENELSRGLRLMTLEGMVSNGFISITSSGLLASFALALGANNFQIGILAAIPFLMQPLQVPAILLVERLRKRKLIAVMAWTVAQLLWFPIALIPFIIKVPGAAAVSLLLGLMAVRGIFSAVTNCSWNSWIRDLVPQQILGRFFSRRLAFATAAAAVFGLGAAFFVDYWRGQVTEDNAVLGYTFALLFGALFLGMASPFFMSRMPEPEMQRSMGEKSSLWKTVTTPFYDHNFRQLMKFLFTWSFALNMAVPFFAVYMLQRVGLPLSAVIGLNVLSQIFNILFLRVWGPLADKFGSKAVLSLCASLYLLVIFVWTFTMMPERHFLTIPLLVALHIFAGIAAAGVSLTISTIGFKLAPQAQSASYLAGASLATNLGAGIGPLLGGFLALFFSTRELSLDITWADPERVLNLGVIHLAEFDFLFVITFIIGLATLNTLAALREEGAADRNQVLSELRSQTRAALQSVSAVPGSDFIDMLPVGILNRVPGIDVAIGVTAYQIADTAKTITLAVLRSGRTVARIAQDIQNGLGKFLGIDIVPLEHDTEVARQAARGALHAIDETPDTIETVAAPALVGIVSALDKAHVSPYDAIRGAAYGIIQGAKETRVDLAAAAKEAIAGARDTARSLNLEEEEAAFQAAQGAWGAARILGPEAEALVTAVLSPEIKARITQPQASGSGISAPGQT